MKVNMGGIDRTARTAVGAVLLGGGLVLMSGLPGRVVEVIGAVLLITGIIGVCPLYKVLGIKTCKL